MNPEASAPSAVSQRRLTISVPARSSATGRVSANGSKPRATSSSYRTSVFTGSFAVAHVRWELRDKRLEVSRGFLGRHERETLPHHDHEIPHTIEHDVGSLRVDDVVVGVHEHGGSACRIPSLVARAHSAERRPRADIIPLKRPG